MDHLSYIDAWSRWLSGESVSNYYLFGIRILWWGRIGKVVSFLSALTILAEIIGPERLREFGASLRSRFTPERLDKFVQDFLKTLRPGGGSLFLGALTLGLCAAALAFLAVWNEVGFWAAGLSLVVFIGVYLSTPLVFVFAVTVVLLVIQPIAWTLDQRSLDRSIKIGSVIMLITGFQFDLLAS